MPGEVRGGSVAVISLTICYPRFARECAEMDTLRGQCLFPETSSHPAVLCLIIPE